MNKIPEYELTQNIEFIGRSIELNGIDYAFVTYRDYVEQVLVEFTDEPHDDMWPWFESIRDYHNDDYVENLLLELGVVTFEAYN